MAYTVKEFLARDMKTPAEQTERCAVCHQPIGGSHDGAPCRADGKTVDEDCYFRALGDFIEQHPIGIPRSHRSS